MTELERKKMEELEKLVRQQQSELKGMHDGIIFYRTYFQICKAEETDPSKKKFYQQLLRHGSSESL